MGLLFGMLSCLENERLGQLFKRHTLGKYTSQVQGLSTQIQINQSIYIYNKRPHMRVHKVLPRGAPFSFFFFFYIFSLIFFYCYPIDYSNLFLLLYKFSIFQIFLLSFFYCYPIDHSNFFLLLYTTWTALDNQTKSYSLQN